MSAAPCPESLHIGPVVAAGHDSPIGIPLWVSDAASDSLIEASGNAVYRG